MSTNREFLMLAKVYDPSRHNIAGWYLSVKHDGQRAFWDGGITRGMPKSDVPWANTDKDKRDHISTGLWSRYGNVIHAPSYFLDSLPEKVFLDGELWMGRGSFQEVRGVVSRLVPDERWRKVEFRVIDSPPPEAIFQTGRINNPNFKKQINEVDCRMLYRRFNINGSHKQFRDTANTLFQGIDQIRLPTVEHEAKRIVEEELIKEMSRNGEGLILRHPYSYWTPHRTSQILKVIKLQLDEGIVKGYTWGEGKYEGMMGAAIVEFNGQTFNLSGFTDEERRLYMMPTTNVEAPAGTPDSEVSQSVWNPRFPRDSEIRFAHKGLTDAGKPREARYLR